MPELPEMEHYRRMLIPRITGKLITGVTVTREKSINVEPGRFASMLIGRKIEDVGRKAKMLLFRVDSGAHVLLLHLMLGGMLHYGTPEQKTDRTVQVTLSFGSEELDFIGLRLGYLHLLTTEAAESQLAKLGPDPFDPAFGPDTFKAKLTRKKGMLKPILVDQSVIAGIGNCYSDEMCFAAGIMPDRRIDSLADDDFARLHRSMRSVLSEAIACGGYMEMPLDAGDRVTGGYNDRCLVYDNDGKPCPRCGHPIEKREIAGRKSFCCPRCQH